MGKQAGKDRTPGGGKDDYETDDEFYQVVDIEFSFGLDAAASKHNAKCINHLNKKTNALGDVDWLTLCPPNISIWINPPYSRGMVPAFLEKAFFTSQRGRTVVLLAHTCPDTKYWDQWVYDKATEIRHIKGRLPFWSSVPDKKGNLGNTSDLPHSLIVYRSYWTGPTHQFSWDWKAAYLRHIGLLPQRRKNTREIYRYINPITKAITSLDEYKTIKDSRLILNQKWIASHA